MFTIKKSLGQHFLHDENVCKKIVAALQEYPFENLLEVGPGAGAITKYLLKIPSINFKAVELDREKIAFLPTKYPAIIGKLFEGDILNIPVPFEGNFTVVGNFPYNISTQILFKVVDWKEQVNCMVGMFQKEVAERIASKAGSKVYGVTSVLIQAFFEVDYLFEIDGAAFTPPPKVKSAVIRLRALKVRPEIKSERALFTLVKTAFNQRRKMLRNSVKGIFDAETLQDKLFDRRPEQLTVEEFAALTFRMNLAKKAEEEL